MSTQNDDPVIFDSIQVAGHRVRLQEGDLFLIIVRLKPPPIHPGYDDHAGVGPGNGFPANRWPFLIAFDDILPAKCCHHVAGRAFAASNIGIDVLFMDKVNMASVS
ncbi:MAG: hypothetical protein JWS10_2053 [Cypionkella sp.]|nr:hypothetical protein [Cypionkella sp.]